VICSIAGGGESESLSDSVADGLMLSERGGGSSSKLAMEERGEEDAEVILGARGFVCCSLALRREVAFQPVSWKGMMPLGLGKHSVATRVTKNACCTEQRSTLMFVDVGDSAWSVCEGISRGLRVRGQSWTCTAAQRHDQHHDSRQTAGSNLVIETLAESMQQI
jgi:hypothetical protein